MNFARVLKTISYFCDEKSYMIITELTRSWWETMWDHFLFKCNIYNEEIFHIISSIWVCRSRVVCHWLRNWMWIPISWASTINIWEISGIHLLSMAFNVYKLMSFGVSALNLSRGVAPGPMYLWPSGVTAPAALSIFATGTQFKLAIPIFWILGNTYMYNISEDVFGSYRSILNVIDPPFRYKQYIVCLHQRYWA